MHLEWKLYLYLALSCEDTALNLIAKLKDDAYKHLSALNICMICVRFFLKKYIYILDLSCIKGSCLFIFCNPQPAIDWGDSE